MRRDDSNTPSSSEQWSLSDGVSNVEDFAQQLDEKAGDSIKLAFKNFKVPVFDQSELITSIRDYNSRVVSQKLLESDQVTRKDLVNWTGECKTTLRKNEKGVGCTCLYDLYIATEDDVSRL